MTESAEDHITYIKRKEDKTIKLFNEQMRNGNGNVFEHIDTLSGSISDFTDSKKAVTIKPNTNSTQQSKNTKDQSAHKDDIRTQKPVQDFDDDKELWQ